MSQLAFNLSNSQPGPAARPDAFPRDLPDRVALDVEHRGLGRAAAAVGLVVAAADREWYLPWGHPEGAQHPEGAVWKWAKENLVDKDLIFRAAKNDIEVLRRWGLDLEAQGCRPHEVQHAAALLDDHRRQFTLEALAQDRLGTGKLEVKLNGRLVPPDELPDLPANLAAPYARRDGRLTFDLDCAYAADIEAQDLGKVLDLEDELIYCVLGMERAMTYLDQPKLECWIGEVRAAHTERVMEIHRRTGVRVNPDSSKDMAKLFNYLNIGYSRGRNGTPLFPDEYLKKYNDVREVAIAIECRDLSSLLSKYLVKYRDALLPDGRLPYLLHQLRADEGGTITGRFASSKINIQQVYKPDKQVKTSPVTKPWIVRELFLPGQGEPLRFTVHDEMNGDLDDGWLHADASQIEYRLFAHFSNQPPPHSTRIIDAYRANPNLSYHKWVWKELLHERMIYSHAKNLNFAKLYGAGVDKLAWMMECGEAEAEELNQTYDRAVPEAKRLLWYCNNLAEKRGYVRTLLGRRRRYAPGDRYYSALNSVLQGGAADLMKLKLLRLYQERNALTTLARVEECFAVQEFDLRVPITWECSVGKNWKETS